MRAYNKIIAKVNRFLRLIRIRYILSQNKFTPENDILIFSDPRGGSTWLAEILTCIPNTFIYWEPLHVNNNMAVKKMGFGWRQHIPKDAKWDEAKKLFDRILKIKLVSEWLFQKATIKEIKQGVIPVVKFCRGNDLLPWLVNQYHFKYKPIYLIRHPFAVVASQLKQGGWDNVDNYVEIPEMKFNDKYKLHQDFLNSLKTKSEKLTANWCMSNTHNFNSDLWISIFYEDMINDPVATIQSIFTIWNIPIPKDLENKINQKSSTTVDYNDHHSVEDQLKKWQSFFSNDELDKMQRVLSYFEISYYSSDSELPTIERLT